MPGVLKRPFDRVDSDQNGLEGRSEDQRPSKRQATAMINGDMPPTTNGISINGGQHYHPDAGTQEELDQTLSQFQASDPPPELFHIKDGFISLKVLWERMAQEAHNDMEDLIKHLAELPPSQANGYAGPRNDANIEKKNRLWDFAHNWRAKFIKLGVLSAWSTNAEAVSKIIDINYWITTQRASYRAAVDWMGELKRLLMHEKLPAPDLKTALEVLFTGKAAWISDLGYIPQKPLLPKQLLAALRTLNTLLTIRLTTHEEIPSQMEDWIVKSGRATFRVKDEFELDLSIADENYASQLYFIDFRFQFSPKSGLPDGPLRNYVEATANRILSREGLKGCYDFLHEFVLEHKLTVLRNQARDMVRGRWAEETKLCNSNRGIVVQYWTNRPGKKNWIEIAVNSGRRRDFSYSNEPEKSFISIRWHRHGIEVKNHDIRLDPANVSLEQILKEVIAHHINWIFKATKRKLKEHKIYSEGLLSVKHRAHTFEPSECSLKIQLSMDNTLSIAQDGISGRFILSSLSPSHSYYEAQLNGLRDPAADAALRIGLLRCSSTIDHVDFIARLYGWSYTNMFSANQETMVRLFGSDRVRYHLYTVSHWPKQFLMATSSSMEGDRWWVIETQSVPEKTSPEDWITGTYQPLKQAIEIKSMEGKVELCAPNFEDLLNIEQAGSLIIGQLMDVRWLQKRKASFHVGTPEKTGPDKKIPEVYIKFPLPQQGNRPIADSYHDWCRPIIKADYISIARSCLDTITQYTGRLSYPKPHIHALTGKDNDSLAFHPDNGNFSFRVRTDIGSSSVSSAELQMQRLASLIKFLDTAERYALKCSQLSLTKVTFDYSMILAPDDLLNPSAQPDALRHTASIHFPPDSDMRITFAKTNPHLAIQDFLNHDLNGQNGLNSVAVTLCTTLPILNTLSTLQSQHTTRGQRPIFYVLPRSATCYNVSYRNKTMVLEVEIRLRMRTDNVVWLEKVKVGSLDSRSIPGSAQSKKDAKNSQTPSVRKYNKQDAPKAKESPKADVSDKKEPAPLTTDDLNTAWKSLIRERGPGWHGSGNGLVSELAVVETCIRRIDTIFTEIFTNALDSEPETFHVDSKVSEQDKKKEEQKNKEPPKEKAAAEKSKPSDSSNTQSAASKDKTAPAAKKQAPNSNNATSTPVQTPVAKGMFSKAGTQTPHQTTQSGTAPAAQMHNPPQTRPPQNQPSAPQARMHQSRPVSSQAPSAAPPANMHHPQQPQRPPNMQSMQNLQNISMQSGMPQFRAGAGSMPPGNRNMASLQAMQRQGYGGGAPQANMMGMNVNMSRGMSGQGGPGGAPQANMAGIQARAGGGGAQPGMGMNSGGPQRKKTGNTGGPPGRNNPGGGGNGSGANGPDVILID